MDYSNAQPVFDLQVETPLSLTSAAQLAGVSRKTIQRYIKRGVIPKHGSKVKLKEVVAGLEIMKLLKDRRGRKRGYVPKSAKQRSLPLWESLARKARIGIPADRRFEIIVSEYSRLMQSDGGLALYLIDTILTQMPTPLRDTLLKKWMQATPTI